VWLSQQLTGNSPYWLTRFWFQRSLGFIYFTGFLIALNQFRALCGAHGLLPARLFLKRIEFGDPRDRRHR
jgi:hypothetical protein